MKQRLFYLLSFICKKKPAPYILMKQNIYGADQIIGKFELYQYDKKTNTRKLIEQKLLDFYEYKTIDKKYKSGAYYIHIDLVSANPIVMEHHKYNTLIETVNSNQIDSEHHIHFKRLEAVDLL